MKNITTKQFQLLSDNQTVWDLLVENYAENGVEAPPEQKNEGYGTQVCKRCSGMQKVFDGECQSFNASPGVHAIQRIPEFFGHGNHA